MNFEDRPTNEITDRFHLFYVEVVKIFAMGDDHLPTLICACPNKDFTRAICAMLESARKAQTLHVLNVYVTSHCYLAPKIPAGGRPGMAAAMINDTVYTDGQELKYNGPDLLVQTPDCGNFVGKFLQLHEKVVGNG